MSNPEKYANPGAYLDTDDHGRLIEENRAAYIRDEADQLNRKIRELERALGAVDSMEAAEAIQSEIEQHRQRLKDLEQMDPDQ